MFKINDKVNIIGTNIFGKISNIQNNHAILKTKDFKPNDPDDPSRYNIKELTIAITSKYKVIEHNADRFNEKTNTYYWDINANTVDFDLLFSFNSKIKFNPYINIYLMIFISLVVLLVTWISICWFYRKEKINKLKKGVK